jgi:hypothetical protein
MVLKSIYYTITLMNLTLILTLCHTITYGTLIDYSLLYKIRTPFTN